MTDTVEPLRIPLAHSVRYVVRSLPDVPYQYGRGVLRPSEITLTYRTAPDSQLGRVHAYIAGRLWVDGAEIQHAPYGQHYDSGLDSWPAWLTEEARLHDPDAAVSSASVDRAELRDRIAALFRCPPGAERLGDATPGEIADAVLAVLPASVDRAAVLLWAADELDRYVGHQSSDAAPEVEGARLVIRELRRIAGQPSPVEAGKCGYYSPIGAYRCTQPAGHLGYHRHVRPDSDEWSSWVTGTAEPEPPAVGAQQPKEARP